MYLLKFNFLPSPLFSSNSSSSADEARKLPQELLHRICTQRVSHSGLGPADIAWGIMSSSPRIRTALARSLASRLQRHTDR